MCPFYAKETRPRLTPSGGFSLFSPYRWALSCENSTGQESDNFWPTAGIRQAIVLSISVGRAGRGTSQEPVHDPDGGLQGGQRDALVGAVEHGVVVVTLGQHQRGEAVAGHAEPGELLRVGAAAHAVRHDDRTGILG